jgi:hypothetical protein
VTVIAATSRFMAADRRTTSEGAKGDMVKVYKNDHMIAAAAGWGRDCLSLKRALLSGADQPEDLISAISKGSEALVLTRAGKIHHIIDGEVWPSEKLATIGSGGDLAIGFLAGACGRKAPTEKDVRRAFKYVFTRRVDCGGRVDVLSF